MHGHRVTRDIEADGSTHAVGFPRHSPFRSAGCDKAIMVIAVTKILTAAEARYTREHLRVVCRKGVHGSDDFHWPRRHELQHRERWEVR